jgi:hypothetical protein
VTQTPGVIGALAAIAALILVILPARIREAHRDWPAGVVEFVPLAGAVALGLAAGWIWIVAGAAVSGGDRG